MFYKSFVKARRAVTTVMMDHNECRDHLMFLHYSPDPIPSASLRSSFGPQNHL